MTIPNLNCSDERTRKRVMGVSYLVCSFVCIYGFLAAANALWPAPEWQERALLIVRETGWSCAALDGEKIFLFGAYFVRAVHCVLSLAMRLAGFRVGNTTGPVSRPHDRPSQT